MIAYAVNTRVYQVRYEIRTHIAIVAPPARVWDVIADFSHYPDWNPFILEVIGEVRPGASVRYRFEFPKGMRIWAVASIVRFEPGKELLWSAHFLARILLNGDHHFRVLPSGDGGTVFEHGEVFSGILLPIILPLLRLNGPRIYDSLNFALKHRVEVLT
jgi:hypothetical protein